MPESSLGDSGMLREEANATYPSKSSLVMVAGQVAELESKEGVVVLAIVSLVIGIISLCLGIASMVMSIMSMITKVATKNDVIARKARLKRELETLASSVKLWADQVELFKNQMATMCASKNCDANKRSIEATSQYQHALRTFREFKTRLEHTRDTVEKAKADFALAPPDDAFSGSAWFNKKWNDMFEKNTGQESHYWFQDHGIKDKVNHEIWFRYGKNTAGFASDAVQNINEVFKRKEMSTTITEDLALEYNGWYKQGVCCLGGTGCRWCPCDSGYDGGCGTTRRCLACEEGAATDAIFSWSEISNHAGKAVEDVKSAKTSLYRMFQTATIAFNTWKDVF